MPATRAILAVAALWTLAPAPAHTHTHTHTHTFAHTHAHALTLAAAAAAAESTTPWVERTEQHIEAHRKTDVRVIVLDADGEPIEGATVHIEQQRHDFPLGFTLDEPGDWPEPLRPGDGDGHGDDSPGGEPFRLTDRPVWRCFNAVALDGLTGWERMSPGAVKAGGIAGTRNADGENAHRSPDKTPGLSAVETAMSHARRAGLRVHFGGVISADLGRNPGWLGELLEAEPTSDVAAEALTAALDQRLHDALRRTPGPIHHFDLYTHALDHALIEEQLGTAGLRRLFHRARALNPDASMDVRVRDALVGPRRHSMLQRVLAMRDDFVPFDMLAIEPHVTGRLAQAQLQRSFEQFEAMGVAVVLVGLEAGGHGEAGAAYNAETLLRTAFASPSVHGIWFGRLTPDHTTTNHAAPVDAEGEPTPVGAVIDRLFRQTWWTDQRATTDTVGNVRTRVFAGVHRIAAELPDGTTSALTVRVPRDDVERVIVLAP